MSLTKAQIVEGIHQGTGLTRKQAGDALEDILDIIKNRLETGESVLISGFGRFAVKEKRPRRGRNPATGKSIMLDGRKVVSFKCSGVLKDRLNKS